MACVAWPTCGLSITEAERSLPGLIDQLERELAKLGLEREAHLATRELRISELEKQDAVSRGQFNVLDGVFKTIFANRSTREMVTRSVPVSGMSGQSGYMLNGTESGTTERTEQ